MSKKINNIFDKALTYENLFLAYKKARRGKRYSKNVIQFSFNYESYLKYILDNLSNGKYKFFGYNLFYVYEPKKRRILAAKFIDRVVHTWYVESFLLPYFAPQFINTSYACIVGKGMHMASKNVQKGMRTCNRKWDNGYCIKFDVKKFFENIDRKVLYEIIDRKICDKKFLFLTREILDSSSNFDIIKGKGLPIGNYTSQIFANIYLNELDQYIKTVLKCKWYYRYMDDGVIFLRTKEQAKDILSKIEIFSNLELGLELNSKTNIFKISQGVNFCGYKINEKCLKIREKGKRKLKEKLKFVRYNIKKGNIDIDKATSLIKGHIGYMCHANVDNLVKRLFYTEVI